VAPLRMLFYPLSLVLLVIMLVWGTTQAARSVPSRSDAESPVRTRVSKLLVDLGRHRLVALMPASARLLHRRRALSEDQRGYAALAFKRPASVMSMPA
jgi:hypothetical protein